MTPDEALQVLGTAESQAEMQQWAEVTALLRPVYDAALLTGTDQGDAAYFLGWAAFHQRVWDEAYQLLTLATTQASAQHRTDAHTHLQELAHHNASEAAEIFGSDQQDFAAVIAAGDEAIERGDFSAALASYRAVYDGTADDHSRLRGALGVATALAYQNDFTQAAQFAVYVRGNADADLGRHAATLLDWITQQQGAQTAIADGATVDEYRQLMDAGHAAMFARDTVQAGRYYRAIVDSAQFGTVERAKAAHNLGIGLVVQGDLDDGRAMLGFAADHGEAKTQQSAHKILARLDARETAEHLVAELEQLVETD